MRVLPVLACAAPILTSAWVGVSWPIAGVELCVFATISLFWSAASDSRRGLESALAPNTGNNRSLTPDGLPTNKFSAPSG
jgi:hypothetical protein